MKMLQSRLECYPLDAKPIAYGPTEISLQFSLVSNPSLPGKHATSQGGKHHNEENKLGDPFS